MLYKIIWMVRALIYCFLFKRVGACSYIGKPLFIYGWKRISVGKNCRIFPGIRIEVHGKKSSVIIHDNVSIAQNVQITSASTLEIGRNTIILGSVFLTNIHHEYEDIRVPMRDQPIKVRESRIGENCFIGFGASIQAGTRIGKHCIIGAGAVVQGDIPDYSVVAGVPGKIIKKLNSVNGHWEKIYVH